MNYIINNQVMVNEKGMRTPGVKDVEVYLAPTPMRLLTYLIQNPNRVITKEELFKYVWEDMGRIPSGPGLSQYISVLRRHFQSFGFNEKIIESIPKEGIRFNAQVINIENNREDLVDMIKGYIRQIIPTLLDIIKKKFVQVSFLSIIVSSLATWFIFTEYETYGESDYAEWIEFGRIADCNIFIMDEEISSNTKRRYKSDALFLLSSLKLSCKKNDKILFYSQSYPDNFKGHEDHGNEFIAQCSLLQKIYSCQSYYFPENHS